MLQDDVSDGNSEEIHDDDFDEDFDEDYIAEQDDEYDDSVHEGEFVPPTPEAVCQANAEFEPPTT